MRSLALLLLAACSMPDQVGVTPFFSRYDYLGSGDSSWPLVSQEGDGMGVAVEAVWFLSPRQTVVTMPRPEWIGELRGTSNAPTIIPVGGGETKASTLDDIGKLGNTAKDWPVPLQIGAVLGMFGAVLGGLYVLTKKAGK